MCSESVEFLRLDTVRIKELLCVILCAGFMDLNQMEANDALAEGEQVDDLWVTLSSMGFADDLQRDEV